MADSDISPSPSPIKRYYYTDPLAETWMAKHFGMRFQKLVWDECSWPPGMWHDFDLVEVVTDGWGNPSLPRGGKPYFYIHPDSLPLLEPDGLDLCRVTYDNGFSESESIEPWGYSKLSGERPALRLLEIIQRGGKPFFWLESETQKGEQS
jgi:hypothetical protein